VPVLGSSAYNTADDVLTRVRTICNDSEVAGGDIITSTAPFAFDLLNAGFERVQLELAKYGVEVDTAEAWLIGLPTMPTIDPEARMVIDDSGCSILYPNGLGNVFNSSPAFPSDLVVPLKLWERQTGTTNPAQPLKQPNSGLIAFSQDLYLKQWEWEADGIRTLGAMQSLDLKIKYEKHLPKLVLADRPGADSRGGECGRIFLGRDLCGRARRGGLAELQTECERRNISSAAALSAPQAAQTSQAPAVLGSAGQFTLKFSNFQSFSRS
jgi:hypothetical protein